MLGLILKQQCKFIQSTSFYNNNNNSIIKPLSINFTNLFNHIDNYLQPQQQQRFYSKIKAKQIKKDKQRELKEKKKLRVEEYENTDIKSLPKSNLIFAKKDSDLKKLNLIVGEKSSKRLKETTRSNWHTRHQLKSNNNINATDRKILIDKNKQDLITAPLSSTLKLQHQKDQLLGVKSTTTNQLLLSKNKQFKNQEFDSKLLEKLKEKKLGMFRQLKQKQGVTKLDAIRKDVVKDIERYFGSKLKLVGSAKQVISFLPETIPEVAFIGRSNVGKSSLINALTQRGLAKTSDKPGQTQSINWYELGSTLYLVDLPGYGFAFAKDNKLEQWNQTTYYYLTERKTIKCIFILVDSRHGLKDSDRQLLLELDKKKIKTHVILTKADTVLQNDLAKRIQITNEELDQNYRHTVLPCLPISSKNYSGISDLSKIIKTMKLKTKPIKINPNQKSKLLLSPREFKLKKLIEKEKKLINLKKLIKK